MKLYELAADYENFISAVESGEIPEEAIVDTLESIDSAIEDKADNIACLLKNMAADIEAIKTEENKLYKRRKAKEKMLERIKIYLSDTLQRLGKTDIETARNKISFIKSEVVETQNETAFIEWAMREHDEYITYGKPTVNKTAVKNALKSGVEVNGAYMKTKQNIQIN